MVIETPFYRCFFCGRRFAADFGGQEGTFLHSWKVAVCQHCLWEHRDGLPSHHEAIQQLARLGVTVTATADGVVPWAGAPATQRPISDSTACSAPAQKEMIPEVRKAAITAFFARWARGRAKAQPHVPVT